jgi:Zn-dependent protease with chaperone function
MVTPNHPSHPPHTTKPTTATHHAASPHSKLVTAEQIQNSLNSDQNIANELRHGGAYIFGEPHVMQNGMIIPPGERDEEVKRGYAAAAKKLNIDPLPPIYVVPSDSKLMRVMPELESQQASATQTKEGKPFILLADITRNHSAEELIGTLGHELGHIANGDTTPARTAAAVNDPLDVARVQELNADRLGAIATGNPQAIISFLTKSNAQAAADLGKHLLPHITKMDFHPDNGYRILALQASLPDARPQRPLESGVSPRK